MSVDVRRDIHPRGVAVLHLVDMLRDIHPTVGL